jgi:hypothetical protein
LLADRTRGLHADFSDDPRKACSDADDSSENCAALL